MKHLITGLLMLCIVVQHLRIQMLRTDVDFLKDRVFELILTQPTPIPQRPMYVQPPEEVQG